MACRWIGIYGGTGTEVVAPSPVARGEKGAAATAEATGVDEGGGAAAPVRLAYGDEEEG